MRVKVLNGAVALLLLGALIGGGTWAVADGLLTGRDIENGTITGSDIRDGSITGRDVSRGSITTREIRNRTIRNRDIRRRVITLNRLTRRVQRLVRRGGSQGPAGTPGPPGRPGKSTPTLTSGDFGVIDRNVFGSPVAQLRSGPGNPPAGAGSLGLLVAGPPNFDAAEKIAYGIGLHGRLSRLQRVGFAVFRTQGHWPTGEPASNMPNIQLELNPHLSDANGAITFSTLSFNPVNSAPLAWTTIDATDPDAGRWSLTGRAATATGCVTPSATAGCTFDQIKDRLPDATLFSVMINKGRDFEWQGAADRLRVNGRIADFEEAGVIIKVR